MRKAGRIKNEADAEVVAGMWFISCRDDNPGVFCSSAASRLNTDENNIRKKVEEWRELFRPGINPADPNRMRLDDLTCKLRKLEGLTQEERVDVGNNRISRTTWDRQCFRSQFRRELSAERAKPTWSG